MLEAFERLLNSFGTFFISVMFVFVMAIGSAIGFRYLELHLINTNIENFMSDMLDYAAMHNGFNDPVNGGYTFTQVVNEKLEEYKLENNISGSIQFSPAPGNESLVRTEEVYIIIKPLYPSLNPFVSTLREGKAKDSRGLTHGYVKVTGKDKSNLIDRPVTDVTD